jgi:hypothetical protein
MFRRKGPRPPKRHCRECGTDVYAWAESPLCPSCVRAVQPIGEGESLRDFRRRVHRPRKEQAW